MSDRTKLGLGVLEAALLLGLLGDVLLRATPWGLNVLLWTGALVAGAHALARHRGAARALPAEGGWLWPVALVFAAFFTWRDSLTLRTLDALVVLGALSLVMFAVRGARVKLAGVTDYVASAFVAGASAVFGVFPLVLMDVKWKEVPSTGWSRHVLAVARGLLLALPLVLVFGALLMAADAVYEGLVRDTFNFDSGLAFSHVFLFVVLSWLAGGYLRGLLLARTPITSTVASAASTAFGLGYKSNANAAGPTKAEDAAPTTGDVKGVGTARTSVTDDAPPVSAGADAATATAATPSGGYRFSSGDEEGPAARGESDDDGTATEATAGRVEGSIEGGDVAGPSEKRDEGKTEGADGERKASPQPAGASPYASTPKPAEVGASVATAGAAWARERISLGVVEVGVVLGLLDLLFFSFVAVQLSYFFGDYRHVVTSAGLTFSDYARRGFFELVWVALLALPLLLAAHWLLRKQNPVHERVFRVLAGAMVAMLFVIMASGLWRMRLYQQAYGQTELRLYTTAFMGWLGVVFVWFALTVLRGRRERFACGALVAWLVILGGLHFVNPDDLIVRANVAQAHALQRVERFDSEYAVSTSADAVPALVELLPQMSARDRGYVAARLTSWLDPARTGDWRSWNLARARARRIVRENEATLRDWEARWKEANRTAEAARARTEAAVRGRSEAAQTTITGTPFLIRVERHFDSAGDAVSQRTATLIAGSTGAAGETAVAALQLTHDNGARTRIEVLRVSNSLVLLQDAEGVYVADIERRAFVRQDPAAPLGRTTYVGAFDLDERKVWRFIPAAEAARREPYRIQPKAGAVPNGGAAPDKGASRKQGK